MGKETSQITRFYDPVDALISAFHSGLLKKLDKEFFMHESYSNDHFELESYNTADTIPVATFLNKEYSTKKYIFMFAHLWKNIGKQIIKKYIHSSL